MADDPKSPLRPAFHAVEQAEKHLALLQGRPDDVEYHFGQMLSFLQEAAEALTAPEAAPRRPAHESKIIPLEPDHEEKLFREMRATKEPR